MSEPELVRCNGCPAMVAWGTWKASGKRMCGEPDPTGGLILDDDGHWQTVKAGTLTFPATTRYKSHFATCPRADKYRKAR